MSKANIDDCTCGKCKEGRTKSGKDKRVLRSNDLGCKLVAESLQRYPMDIVELYDTANMACQRCGAVEAVQERKIIHSDGRILCSSCLFWKNMAKKQGKPFSDTFEDKKFIEQLNAEELHKQKVKEFLLKKQMEKRGQQ